MTRGGPNRFPYCLLAVRIDLCGSASRYSGVSEVRVASARQARCSADTRSVVTIQLGFCICSQYLVPESIAKRFVSWLESINAASKISLSAWLLHDAVMHLSLTHLDGRLSPFSDSASELIDRCCAQQPRNRDAANLLLETLSLLFSHPVHGPAFRQVRKNWTIIVL